MSARPDTILVVDDDEDIRQVLGLSLRLFGHQVESVADGVEALRWIEAHGPPALILLDLMLPRLDGEGFVRALRARQRGPLPPVVVLSGHSAAARVAQDLGVAGWMVKPVDLDELRAQVARFLVPQQERQAWGGEPF